MQHTQFIRRVIVVVLAMAGTLMVAAAPAGAASSATVLPLPPLQPLPGPLPAVSFETSDLQLEYVTRFKASDGTQVVRRTPGTLGLARAIDVDGNGTTDLTGTLSLRSATQFQLRFTRPAGQTASLPVSVEAIVNDPTPGNGLPRDRISFGYDGRAATAPASWVSTVTSGSGNGNTSVDVVTTVSGAGSTLRTLGGLFDGDALSPTRVLGGGVRYTAVPATARLGLTLGSAAAEVRAGASSPVTAVADVQIGQATSKRVTATITGMPSMLRVRSESWTGKGDASSGWVRYWATASVPSASLRVYEGMRRWMLDATRIPTEIGVQRTSTGRTTAQVDSGAIGSATVGVADFVAPRTLATTGPYVYLAPASSVVRLTELQQVVVDSAGGLGAEVQLAPAADTPFRAVSTVGGQTLDGTVSNLPRHFRVAYTPADGTVFYNGFGTTIAEADVSMTAATPFFGRVTRINGHVEGLPASVTLNFGMNAAGTGSAFTATPMVKLVEARFRSNATKFELMQPPPLAAGETGAYLRDLPDKPYQAFLRLRNVTGGELSQVGGRLKATLRTAPEGTDYQDLRLYASLNNPDDAVVADARITGTLVDLPPVLTIEQADGAMTFSGSRPITSATFTALNLPIGTAGQSLRGRIHNVEATLTSLPPVFTVHYGSSAQGVSAPYSHFGKIEFSVWDDTGPLAPSEEFVNYVKLDRRDDKLRAWGRVHGVRRAMLESFLQTTVDVEFGAAQPHVEFLMESGSSDDPLTLTAALLPVSRNDPSARIPLRGNLQFVTPPGGFHGKWAASATARLYITLTGGSVSIPTLQAVVPTLAEFCVGGRMNCQPQSPDQPNGVPVPIPNSVTMFTKAYKPITIGGTLCLPNDAGDPVQDTCPKQIKLVNVRLQTARLELGQGEDCSWAGECDAFLKLHLDTDAYGLNAGRVYVSEEDLYLWTTSPVRNVTVGTPFTGVSELGGTWTNANDRYHSSQITCDGLHMKVTTWAGTFDAKDEIIPPSWCA